MIASSVCRSVQAAGHTGTVFAPSCQNVLKEVKMADRDIAAFGLFPNRGKLEAAVEAFRGAGFRNSDISILMPEGQSAKDIGTEAHSKAPEGAVAGAASGAVLGGVLGWLVGVGAIAIPGIGPFLAAGPIVAALAGVGAAGTAGGLLGALIGVGIPEYEAKRYEGRIRKGHILLSVHCDDHDWARRAKDLLKQVGAEDVATTGEATADYHAS
jgi:hypothetical protein